MTAAHPKRSAILIAEALVALSVLVAAAALVAHFGTWALTDRARTDARLDAIETATNVLERARARDWNDLTDEWAKQQGLPEYLAARWPDARLDVTIEPEEKRPKAKRVTVEIKWTDAAHKQWAPIKLTAWFAARATEGKP